MAYGPQPDRPPSSPHAFDDEFTSSDVSAWTEIDASGGAYDANTTIESCLYINAPDVGAHTSGVYKACPTLPFRVTAKIAGYSNPLGSSVRTDVGVMLGEATPGKFIHGALDVAEDNFMCIVGSKWTSPTVWSANIGDFLSGGSGAGSRSRVSGFGLLRPMWVRFDVHSSTNVDGYFSFDGNLYTKWLSAYNPAFTIGSVGIDVHSDNATTEVAVDYIRFVDL